MAYDIRLGQSWQSAYAAAPDGAVLTVEPGAYATQVLMHTGRAGKVTFNASGATMPFLESRGAQHVVLRGLKLTGGGLTLRLSTQNQNTPIAKITEDWLIEDVDITTFLWRNVKDVTMRRARIGGFNQSVEEYGVPKIGAYVAQNGAPPRLSTNVLIEDAYFHDVLRTISGTAHAEGFYFDSGCDGITLRRCTFTNCGVFDIFSNGPSAGRPIQNILMESCLLDIPRDQTGGKASSAINFKGGSGKVVLRGCSILGNIRLDPGTYDWTSEKNAVYGITTLGTTQYPNGIQGKDVKVTNLADFVSASVAPCNLSSCFRNDLHVKQGTAAYTAGAGVPVGGTTPPPNPEPEPPDSLPLTVLSDTATNTRVGWTPVSGVGYRFLKDGKVVSQSWNPALESTSFDKPYTKIAVESLLPGPKGDHP